jgi:radical SAM superfamily enzyme YgiQ (UPF0313 family)
VIHLGLDAAAEKELDLLMVSPRHPIRHWACPPLGALALAQYLDARGFETAVWDCMHDPAAADDNLAQLLKQTRTRVVGLSFLSSQLGEARRLADLIRAVSPDTLIVAGGQHVSAVPEERIDADHVVVGEGELALESLLLNGRAHPRVIRGADMADLSLVPLPDQRILAHYGALGCAAPLAVLTTRGCPFCCHFCLGPAQRSRMPRRYPPRQVGQFVEDAYRALGPRDVFFVDDVFTVDRRWLSEVCEELSQRNLKHLGYRCFSHVRVRDPEIYRCLAGAGFDQVQIGVESGDEVMLRRMGKNFRPQHARDMIATVKDCGIEPVALFLLGYPGDTMQSMHRTLRFAESLETPCWFSIAQPFPGSRFFEEARQTGALLDHDYARYSNQDIVYLPEGVSLAGMQQVVAAAHDIVGRHQLR